MATISITPINGYLKKSLIFKECESPNEIIPIQIVGIQAYEGEELAFQILVDGQFLYSFIKSKYLLWDKSSSFLDLELKYVECPDWKIDVYDIPYLQNKRVTCKYPDGRTGFGEYILSIDFYEANHQLHLIKVSSGHFAFFPNHKLNFGGDSFPNLLKIRD